MLKVIVADDEQYEREYLKTILSEKYEGLLDVVYCATDGVDVLEKVSEYRPEIVLLDIKMPRLNGLEAAEQLREKYPKMQIIILSAYDEFSYAKQAMKLGVRDFLVKPYLDSELVETLDKVITYLGGFSTDNNKADDTTVDKIISDIDKDVVWNLAFANKSDSAIKRDLMMWGIEKCMFKCIVFFHSGIRKIESNTYEIIKGLLKIKNATTLVSYMFDQIIVYVFATNSDAFSELNGCIRKTRAFLQEGGDDTVFCGVSGIYQDEKKFDVAYEEAANFVLENVDRNERERYEKTTEKCKKVCELEDKAIFAIAARNRERELYWLNTLWDYYHDKLPDKSARNHFFRSILTIMRTLNRQLEVRITTEEVKNVMDDFEDDGDGKLIERIVDIFYSDDENRTYAVNPVLVKKAKEYIGKNYQMQIGLNDVADHMHVSSGHLSKCFRNTEGIGFTEYLTNIRLENAKKLLTETDMSIQDVAFEVGFSDPNYFGKSFKKHVGMSPKEYCSMQELK